MRVVLLAATSFAIFTVALYAMAGRWASIRTRRAEDLADRILLRVHRRTVLLFCGTTVLGVVSVLLVDPVVPRAFAVGAAYLGPFLWLWALVAGESWLELAARGIDVDLWRFHRFDVFATFLTMGQRIPFFSAAFVALADLRDVSGSVSSVLNHGLVAVGLGLALRGLVVRRLVRNRHFPEEDLVELRAIAERAGVYFRRIRVVPTERGQSVNALAATSSRTVYVAQGLVEGLERDEVRAVLLHEIGHFAQPLTNAFRIAAIAGWPLLLWGVRAVPTVVTGARGVAVMAGLLGLGVAGSALARIVYRASERRADRFAVRYGGSGPLVSALTKMYGRSTVIGGPGRTSRHRPPILADRLGDLESSTAAGGYEACTIEAPDEPAAPAGRSRR